jgi:hypothetical protein
MGLNTPRETLPSLSKTSPTLILSAVAILVSVCVYAFAEVEKAKANERLMPVVAWKILAKKTRQFHDKAGRVPNDAKELFGEDNDGVVNISEDGHVFYGGNYFYFFSKLDNKVVGIWAIPYGPRASEASSYYVTVAAPKGERVWKGPAFERGDSKSSAFSPNPTLQQLALLGMTEQPVEKNQR